MRLLGAQTVHAYYVRATSLTECVSAYRCVVNIALSFLSAKA